MNNSMQVKIIETGEIHSVAYNEKVVEFLQLHFNITPSYKGEEPYCELSQSNFTYLVGYIEKYNLCDLADRAINEVESVLGYRTFCEIHQKVNEKANTLEEECELIIQLCQEAIQKHQNKSILDAMNDDM